MSLVNVTVTVAVVSARRGRALAWIVAVPVETPVTGTCTVVAPVANDTVAGTVAAAVLLELRLMIVPAGAGEDRVKVRLCGPAPLIERVGGVNVMVPLTCTGWLAEVNPVAVAETLLDPNATPVTCGCDEGVVWPAAMNTEEGEIVSAAVLLLCNETVTPPAGAGADSVTEKVTD